MLYRHINGNGLSMSNLFSEWSLCDNLIAKNPHSEINALASQYELGAAGGWESGKNWRTAKIAILMTHLGSGSPHGDELSG